MGRINKFICHGKKCGKEDISKGTHVCYSQEYDEISSRLANTHSNKYIIKNAFLPYPFVLAKISKEKPKNPKPQCPTQKQTPHISLFAVACG